MDKPHGHSNWHRYDPDRHHRRSIGLQGYDYAQAGAYYVTICTQHRQRLFGDIIDRAMVLSEAGRMVQTVWDEIPAHYPGVDIDAFIVMPDHIHGIIIIGDSGPQSGPPRRVAPKDAPQPPDNVGAAPRGRPDLPRGRPLPPSGLSLPDVVHRFKTMTTKRYTDGVKHNGWPPFPGKLWQRNYWERIIRNEAQLSRIREYIHNNPAQWESDQS